ncbi:9352_t:CDS:2, partial [Cetraspora pellucida]
MDCNELLDLEYKFAKAVFAFGIPFNAFQNLFWTEFFYTLQPSFKIPNNIKLFEDNYNKEIALILPSFTRWSTHLDCINSLMKSQTAIQQMLFDP